MNVFCNDSLMVFPGVPLRKAAVQLSAESSVFTLTPLGHREQHLGVEGGAWSEVPPRGTLRFAFLRGLFLCRGPQNEGSEASLDPLKLPNYVCKGVFFWRDHDFHEIFIRADWSPLRLVLCVAMF